METNKSKVRPGQKVDEDEIKYCTGVPLKHKGLGTVITLRDACHYCIEYVTITEAAVSGK